MKTRSFISIALTITSALLLILTMTAAAQGSIVTDASQSMTTGKVFSGYVSGLSASPQNATGPGDTAGTITAVTPSYLPIVFRDVGVCSGSPTLINPPNGSQLATIIPMFIWDDGSHPQASSVSFAIATDFEFKHIISGLGAYPSPGIQQFRFSYNFNPSTIYYWRGWFQCGNLQGPFSATSSFTTGSGGTILPAPALVAPGLGSVTPTTSVTFQWSAVPDAIQYLLQFNKLGEEFSFSWTWVDGTQATLSLDPNTVYQWHVAARNDYAVGNASDTWQFTTPAGSSEGAHPALNPIFVTENGNPSLTFEMRAQQK